MPDYREAVRTRPRKGDPDQYCTHVETHGVYDYTSFMVGQAKWSLKNLPNILYTIEQPEEQRIWGEENQIVSNQRGGTGYLKYERWGYKGGGRRRMRNLPVLPQQIALEEDWWRIEAWRRLDPRVTYEDINMRQRPINGVRTVDPKIDQHKLRANVERHRAAFSILDWYAAKNPPSEITNKIRSRLTLQQIHDNSSRGLTPGLRDPSKGEVPGNRVLSIKDLPGPMEPTYKNKRLSQWHLPPDPVTPERPRKRVKQSNTIESTRRSARLQASPNGTLSSPVRAFQGLAIESTDNTPQQGIKAITSNPSGSGNNGSGLSPRHLLQGDKDDDEAGLFLSPEVDPDDSEMAEFEEIVAELPSSSSEDESNPEDTGYELESQYGDHEVSELSQAAPAQEIEESEMGTPEPEEGDDWGDRLPTKRTLSIDLQDDAMDAEAGRVELLTRFMSVELDNGEQDHTAEGNIPITKPPQVELHQEDTNVQPEGIPQDQTALTSATMPGAPISEETPKSKASNGLLESLVSELSQLRNAVVNLNPSESQSADLIGTKIDRLARISLDMQTGAAMLVDEISALRAEVHRLGG